MGLNPLGRHCVRSVRRALAGILVAGVALTAVTVEAAAAPNSSIVVDAKTGKVLYSKEPDALRRPASLTKMMTLYLLFGELESGRLTMSSRLRVSEFASRQRPTKLGLKPGSTIAVRDAMLGLITRSANDAAVVIAENLSGSEAAFAQRMTRTARSIGMSRTTFRNASGLPNDGQWSTARDMATLGRALQDRYPRYYKFFATKSFVYNGRVINGHNRLLGRVNGVDGIKTGYTNASGYNLVSSVKRDNRALVATVMGGNTGAARDKQMAT
ncbi:MAG TPA: D-alanyl-D-alanine carboxypeptidase family protein, partial [Kaistia sp.]|nr:D-alanyl-D-alanine carboxypeptidase family protein [Kaistia sp.]